MSAFWTVLVKELLDAVRDRRSLFAALLYPLFGPLLVVGMYAWMGKQQAPDRPVQVVVLGGDHAPRFVAFLETHGVEARRAPSDPEAALAEGDLDAIVEIPSSFGEDLRAQRPAVVRIVTNGSRPKTLRAAARLERLVDRYGRGIGLSRLLLRGVDPRIVQAVAPERVDLSTERSRAAMVLGFLPLFVVLAAFVGGMYVATDASAGERERGSLEPLLLHPVSRAAIVAAKWAATSVFAVTSLLFTAVAMWAAFRLLPVEGLGVPVEVDARLLVGLVVVALPVAPLAASVQLLLAFFARTFKEAQTYLSLLIFVPMLLGIVTTADPIVPRAWMSFVPVLGPVAALGAVLRGDALPPSFVAACVVVSLVLAAACIVAASRLLRSERIVFGR